VFDVVRTLGELGWLTKNFEPVRDGSEINVVRASGRCNAVAVLPNRGTRLSARTCCVAIPIALLLAGCSVGRQEKQSWLVVLLFALIGLALHSDYVLGVLVEAVRTRWQPTPLDPNDSRPIEPQ
jgi:hypothetical protein